MKTDNSVVAISGGAGLIGSAFAHWLLENTAHKICIIDNLSGGYKENLPDESDRFKFYLGDATSPSDMTKLFKESNPKYFFNAACWAAEGASPFMRMHTATANVILSANVINHCLNYNIKRLVHLSSMAIYGNGNFNPPFGEDTHPPAPIDPYGVYKSAVELDIKCANEQHGLDFCILRPHNAYSGNLYSKYNSNGYGQVYTDRYRNFLAILQYQYLQGKPLTIFGDGLQKRAFSHVQDSLPCFYRALIEPQCSKQIINLGGIHETTILEAANTLVDVLKQDGYPFGVPEIIHLQPRHEVKLAYPTWAKSVELLGFEHRTDLHEGLTKMWQWVKEDYKKNNRKQLSFEEYELSVGIYDFWKNK